jgi:hypothetical protein
LRELNREAKKWRDVNLPIFACLEITTKETSPNNQKCGLLAARVNTGQCSINCSSANNHTDQ